MSVTFAVRSNRFQSTPSARRATDAARSAKTFYIFQSTPSARRATVYRKDRTRASYISIHALREEGDAYCKRHEETYNEISIHALREEGDTRPFSQMLALSNFNPRPPRGGRQQKQRKNPPLLFHYTRLCTI